MRHYLFVVIFFTLITLLTGCSNIKYRFETYENVNYLNSLYPGKAWVLHTKTEADTFSDDNNIAEISGDLLQKLSSYDNDFFTDNMLIVVYHAEPTSSSKLSVKGVEFRGNTANVSIKSKSPKFVDWMIKCYAFLFEVPQDNSITDAAYEVK
jgi:hypothetical protein